MDKYVKDRIYAAVATVLLIGVLFGGLFWLKGCKEYTVEFCDGETVVYTANVAKGETAEEYKYSAEGKEFDCWVDSSNVKFDFSTPITKDIRLYAKWK